MADQTTDMVVSTAKWSLIGVITTGLLGAIATAGILALGGGLIGSLGGIGGFSTFGGGAAAMLTGPFAGLTSFLSIVGGITSAVMGGGYGALAGGLFGLAKSGNRSSHEALLEHKRAFGTQQKVMQAQSNGEIQGMQQGYQMGVNDGYAKGQQDLMIQIQEQMIAQQQMAAQAEQAHAHKHEHHAHDEAKGKFAAKCEAKCVSKVEMIDKQREAAAAAPPQIGA